jgi:ribonuclease HII
VPDFSIETKLEHPVIGLDEVGRGPLAGPVISCGCYFKSYKIQNEFKDYIGDSKKLSEKKREASFKFLQSLKNDDVIEYHLGIANVNEIDQLNILEATKLSMRRVVDKFNMENANLLIDGNFSLNYKSYKEQSIVRGDDKSLSIAAASIIAKVHRDRLMKKLSLKFQNFGWEKNAGYGTKMHIENIYRLGPTIYHRKTFEPIKSLIHN